MCSIEISPLISNFHMFFPLNITVNGSNFLNDRKKTTVMFALVTTVFFLLEYTVFGLWVRFLGVQHI